MIAPPLPSVWVEHPNTDLERTRRLALELDAPLPVASVLVHRGIDSPEAARRFLAPSLDDLHDPFLLRDLDRAVGRILRAVQAQEPILIFGDYDVDGITATYLLYTALLELGARVEYRIPHRTRDGYGLSLDAVEWAHRRGFGLVVTVDCGITAVEPVQLGLALGIDVVITDHHEPGPVLPPACAVVNPHRVECSYPFKSLAGVGVTFKLVEALLADRGGRERAGDFLDIVAIGTIADVVPLVGENRVLARAGLDRLNRSTRLGLRALIEAAGLAGRSITSGHVAFMLAPRINAGGRMGNAEQGLRLLLARDEDEACACADSLEDDNDRRRQADEIVLAEASERVESELGWPDCASIVLGSDRWHPGVIGIVASRLVERYQRPTILVALKGEWGRGSGRSLPRLDLTRLLGHASDLLDSYGGHAFAAGLTVQRDRLPELQARIETLVSERLSPEDCLPRLFVDGWVRLSECDLELVEWLDRLSPHGLGNGEPVLVAPSLMVDAVATAGEGKHLTMRVRDLTAVRDVVGFGLGHRAADLRPGMSCDLALVPCRRDAPGSEVQLRIRDVRVS